MLAGPATTMAKAWMLIRGCAGLRDPKSKQNAFLDAEWIKAAGFQRQNGLVDTNLAHLESTRPKHLVK